MRHFLRAAAVGLVALPSLVAAQGAASPEPQRQLGAHTHGTGKLGIAIERRTIEIELEAPGSDIVGFEHTARTAEQKKAISEARALLAKPLELFKFPAAAACKVASAKVRLVGHNHSHGHSHSHSHSHGSAKSKDADAHSEFKAEYRITCTRPDQIGSIDVEYFKTFPRAEALDVTLIGGKGQAKQKVTRDKPRIQIGGTS
jgi:hypothetical protein